VRSRTLEGGELAIALHVLRIIRGWTQREVATAAGKRPGAISYYESGLKAPELPTLRALLEGMGYQLSTLDEARAFIRQVQRGEIAPDTDARLLALEVGQVAARFAAALLGARK
jgi:transcriptional regulator with XRE-family HTH domain